MDRRLAHRRYLRGLYAQHVANARAAHDVLSGRKPGGGFWIRRYTVLACYRQSLAAARRVRLELKVA